MEYEIINDKFNGVRIVKNAEGKFAIQEIIEGEELEPEFRYRGLYLAEKNAKYMSDKNDKLDQYEASFK